MASASRIDSRLPHHDPRPSDSRSRGPSCDSRGPESESRSCSLELSPSRSISRSPSFGLRSPESRSRGSPINVGESRSTSRSPMSGSRGPRSRAGPRRLGLRGSEFESGGERFKVAQSRTSVRASRSNLRGSEYASRAWPVDPRGRRTESGTAKVEVPTVRSQSRTPSNRSSVSSSAPREPAPGSRDSPLPARTDRRQSRRCRDRREGGRYIMRWRGLPLSQPPLSGEQATPLAGQPVPPAQNSTDRSGRPYAHRGADVFLVASPRSNLLCIWHSGVLACLR
jgi:hypothetical protein